MTPDQLKALIAERLPDNTQNRITPADLRAVCQALASAQTSAPSTAARPHSAAHRLYLFTHFT